MNILGEADEFIILNFFCPSERTIHLSILLLMRSMNKLNDHHRLRLDDEKTRILRWQSESEEECLIVYISRFQKL